MLGGPQYDARQFLHVFIGFVDCVAALFRSVFFFAIPGFTPSSGFTGSLGMTEGAQTTTD
jgi:hypothetical protein